MAKIVKKIYIPSGVIASMYNLFGGNGEDCQCLSMHDIQLLTAYMEYYYNFTSRNEADHIYNFYTLPHFYSADPDSKLDNSVKAKETKIRKNNTSKVSDVVASEDGRLFLAYKALYEEKSKVLKKKVEEINNGKEFNFPQSPYEWALSLGDDYNFRIRELYAKKRYNGEPLFPDEPCKDMSVFFVLNGKMAGKKMTPDEFKKNREEINRFLHEFLSSGCYKVLAEDKTESFAPSVAKLMKSFEMAVQAYNKTDLNNLNNKYLSDIKKAEADNVVYGAVKE